jgi:hypothetical protein
LVVIDNVGGTLIAIAGSISFVIYQQFLRHQWGRDRNARVLRSLGEAVGIAAILYLGLLSRGMLSRDQAVWLASVMGLFAFGVLYALSEVEQSFKPFQVVVVPNWGRDSARQWLHARRD